MLHILKSKIVWSGRLSDTKLVSGKIRLFTVLIHGLLKRCGPEYMSDSVELPFGERVIESDDEEVL